MEQSLRLGLADSQALRHLVVAKSLTRHIRLHPLAIDHELWNGLLASVLDDLSQRTRRGLDVDLFIGNVVLGQEAFGLAAIGTPGSGVNRKVHEISSTNRVRTLAYYVLSHTDRPRKAKAASLR